jgi:hypothetical protein
VAARPKASGVGSAACGSQQLGRARQVGFADRRCACTRIARGEEAGGSAAAERRGTARGSARARKRFACAAVGRGGCGTAAQRRPPSCGACPLPCHAMPWVH